MITKLKQISFAAMASSILLVSCGEDSSKIESAPAGGEKENKAASEIRVGDVLKTEYFDVTVTHARFSETVKASEYEELPKEAGNKYLVMHISLKNTDTESRMMTEGTVLVKLNGKEYKFEQSELVAAEGYGMIVDNINPLITKKTRLVYKIPAELEGGDAYYNPARADDDEVISLGKVR